MKPSLLLVLLLSTASSAQDWAGDYRLEGEDSASHAYLVELAVDRQGSTVRLSRTAIYVEDEHRLAEPVTWVASEVRAQGRRLFVTFGGEPTAGLTAVLNQSQTDSSDDLKAPVTGVYYLSGDGLRATEWLRSEEKVGGKKKGWRWAYAKGGPDLPSLILESEAKFADLFDDLLSRYEASGVTNTGDRLRVVFDNSRDLAEIGPDLRPDTSDLYNGEGGGASDFEGVAYDALEGRTYLVVEADRHDGDLAPRLWQLKEDLSLKRKIWLPYNPPSRGKGFEGLLHVRRDGEEYLLALLEGNYGKSDERSIQRGHGRIVVFERQSAKKWEVEDIIKLPATAAFSDYSGLDLRDGRLAVVSQTSSLLWVGALSADDWTIEGEGQVYRFPRQESVAVYASIEGVAWLDSDRVAVVSDEYSGDCVPCEAKDQSIHIFALPK